MRMVSLVVLLALSLTGCTGNDEAADTGLQAITIHYPTRSGASWPMFLAREGGYYEKYGLDVELTFGNALTGLVMLTNDEAQMTNSSMEQALLAASQDASLVMVGSSLNRGLFALMGQPELSSVEDLRGRRVGVSQVGDAPYNYSVALLGKYGLRPTDVQWVPVGAGGAATRAAALSSGLVDAALLTAPAFFTLEEAGYPMLADMTEHDDVYAATVYLFPRAALEETPDLAGRIVRAHAEGIERFYADKEFAVAAYLAYDPEQSPEDIARVYDRFRNAEALERVPYVLEDAVQAILGQVNTTDSPQVAGFDFSTVIDNTIVDRLVDEGFFVDLFGPGIDSEQEQRAAAAFR